MKYDRLPDRRAHRRIVFVVDQKTIDSLETDPTARELLLREDAALIHAATDPDQTDPVTRGLESQGLLTPGAVLVLSPYRDGDYAPLDEAMDRFSLQKWTALSTLCAFLGARSLSVEVIEDTLTSTRVTFGAGGGRGPVKVAGKGDVKHMEAFVAQMNLEDTYSGGECDIQRATDFLTTSGLGADPAIRSLAESRSFPGNTLATRSLTIDLSRESERTIDAALTIKVPAVLNAQATFQHAKESKAHYRVTMKISFDHDSSARSG